jgi:hypothetical protein
VRLRTIRPGDIVEVDVRGWRAHCQVLERSPGGLEVRALPGLKFPWRHVKARQVVRHWAWRGRPRAMESAASEAGVYG